MNQRILAFDFDGTIAEDGQVPIEIIEVFRQAHDQSHALFLVTGRLFRQADIAGILPYLTGIVWENGAVLEHLPTERVSVPFGTLPELLVKDLEQTGIEMLTGMAIAATWAQHEGLVKQVSDQHHYCPTLDWNKLALMILPTGANKGSGLKRLLEQCHFSSHTLMAFGDGENDHSLLAIADTAVAVQDAVPSLQEMAHVVSNHPGPSGVVEILEDLLGEGAVE
jgi:hydroxymethylpyrimidine pyrophosphatase-like HAD family hydrolase